MTKTIDDFEATREVVKILEGFSAEDQLRIIRWASEKVGLLASSAATGTSSVSQNQNLPPSSARTKGQTNKDIKSFIEEKNPQTDNHLAATVAYYYRFQANPEDRKDEIDGEDLLEACRLANRPRLKKANKTLHNALGAGLLNSGSKGKFVLNTVGENLVAMSLPNAGGIRIKKKSTRQKKKAKRKGKK